MSAKKKLSIEEEEEIIEEPEVEVIGDYPILERRRTGLFSLDYALQNKGYLGLPLRLIVELSGYVGVGKSTLAYYLSGEVAEKDNIAICDVEMLDRDYIRYAVGMSGFKGQIHLMDVIDKKKKMIPHERMIWRMVKELDGEDTGAAILDSISGIQPTSEQEVIDEKDGAFGQAFMGKRARLVGQISRAISTSLKRKDRPSNAFYINHAYQILGGHGHTTAGGTVKDALAGVKIHMWTTEVFSSKDNTPPLGFLVKGQIEKLRFGGKGGTFQFYIVPGRGVHPGVSAMFDCFEFGLAERGAVVKLDDKSMGYLQADLLTYAAEGKQRKFYGFQEKLEEYARKVEQGKA